MPVTCVLAIALLSAAPDAPIPSIEPGDWPAVQAAVWGLAVEWELLDAREERLQQLEHFSADLTVLRQRYADLKGAPMLRDSNRFPERGAIGDVLSFNRTYRRNLEQRRAVDRDRADSIHDAACEADALYRVWDSVREARCEIYYVPVRRLALARLRESIGEGNFQAGLLPPPVPLWRFADAR